MPPSKLPTSSAQVLSALGVAPLQVRVATSFEQQQRLLWPMVRASAGG